MSLAALQAIRDLFNDLNIIALREWITLNGGEMGVYQSKQHLYLFVLDRRSGRQYIHPYNPDIREKALAAAEVIAAVSGALEIQKQAEIESIIMDEATECTPDLFEKMMRRCRGERG